MKQFTFACLVMGLALCSNAQIESAKWLLSNNNVIEFGEEISIVDHPEELIPQGEGTAMVAHTNEGVIFTATSYAIYDSVWAIINNGDSLGITDTGTSFQSPIVLQKPGSPTEYYVFYLQGQVFNYVEGDLKYSIVNICDENDEISIDEDEKNIQIDGNFSERLHLVEIDRDNYWLLATELNETKLWAYKIDTSGINLTPVVSGIDFQIDKRVGAIKVNNAKDKLAWSSSSNLDEPGLTIFDFDVNTGEISNPQILEIGPVFGIEWSPLDNYLYYTRYKSFLGLYSYKMEDGTKNTLFSQPSLLFMGDLKLSPNQEEIIVVQHFNNKLARVTDIENGGDYSEIDLEFLGDVNMFTGIQEQVINYGIVIPPEIVSSWDLVINSGEDSTVVLLPGEFTNVEWSDGQIGNAATFTEEGMYSVSAYYNCSFVNEEFTIKYQKVMLPDVNSTFIDIPVNGSVNTNDAVHTNTTYGTNPILIHAPAEAAYNLIMNSDGTYTFTADRLGNYEWDVPVCVPLNGSVCEGVNLEITVVDVLSTDFSPLAHPDIGTALMNNTIEISTLKNDKCAVLGGCTLDPNTLSILTPPKNGAITIDYSTGNTTYSPNLDFIGLDTLEYEVCVTGQPSNCAQTEQIIIVEPTAGPNTTLATDDFSTGAQEEIITGNVTDNDLDPNGDNLFVEEQQISLAAGSFTLLSDGSYTFVPHESFYGPVEFMYTICDDNINPACASATLYILIQRDVYVQVRVYLQGAMIGNGNEIGTTHARPLMRDDLRESPFTGERFLPDSEPYDSLLVDNHWETADNPLLYDPFKRFDYDYSMVDNKFITIVNPNTIFEDNGEDAVVDWISIELRDKNDYGEIVASRSGLVQRDGDVMDLNEELGLRFKGLEIDDYYVVVRHRNHLGAMTSTAKTPYEYASLIDFTVAETGFFDFGTTKNDIDYTGWSQANLFGPTSSNKSGYKALWAGDFDGNGRVKYVNPLDDLNTLLGNIFGYETEGSFNYSTNFDLALGYLSGDFDMNSKSKFDSPNDDKNSLFGQLLFYPLNIGFSSNFNFFIEQVPENFILK
ncbi:MAG: Ig-like domain-containing protein [Saprospiraceae bacterium]|nr:Ig-like domain-containing protein [Saprospiraceae bacterium]